MTEINPVELEPTQKRQFWQEQINQQLQSKLSQAQFCNQNGIKLHQFTYWKCRFNKKAAAGSVTFVSVPIGGAGVTTTCRAGLNLITAKGYRIEVSPGFDPATLKRLIAALELP